MILRCIQKRFTKSRLSFVQDYQDRLRVSRFRERVFDPDFKYILNKNPSTVTDAQHSLNIDQLEECLVQPFWDLANRESKFMRPILVHISAEILGIKDQQRILDLSGFVECLHNSTLVLDDVIDSSMTRRGKPCVHLIYGVDTALTCYGFVDHFLIRSIVDKLQIHDFEKKAKVYESILKCLEELYIGLAWDVEWHKDKSFAMIPSFENFSLMLELKTSKLLNLANEILGILYDVPSEKIDDLKAAYNSFGISFQINDDLINIYNEDYSKLKGISDDIIESKLSYPILFYIEYFKNQPDRIQRLFDAMNIKDKSPDDIQKVLELIKTVDCFEPGMEIARQKMDQCCEILAKRFGDQSSGLSKIKQLGEYILTNEFLKLKR